jgi:hypothetical protein
LRRPFIVIVAVLFAVACSGDDGGGNAALSARVRHRATAARVGFVGERALAPPNTVTVSQIASRSTSHTVSRRSSRLDVTARAGELSAPSATLPNLRPVLSADGIRTAFADGQSGGHYEGLRFTVDSVNAGDYPMEILSTPKDASTNEQAAQCLAWKGRLCTQYQPVGEVYFHQEHMHWHFKDYARYELRQVDDGHVVSGHGGVVANGGKVSFCLEDSFGPDVPADQAAANPWLVVPVYNTCNPLVQGISPKWTDEYAWALPGQSLALDRVADGIYALVVTLNPSRILFETNYDDNTTTELLRIGTAPWGDRTVEVLDAKT